MTVVGEQILAALNGAEGDMTRERAAAIAEATILRAPRAPWMLVIPSTDPPDADTRREIGRRAGAAGAFAVLWTEGDPNPAVLDDDDLAEAGLVRIDRVRAALGEDEEAVAEAHSALLVAILVYDGLRED
jgi:hypothetical protein